MNKLNTILLSTIALFQIGLLFGLTYVVHTVIPQQNNNTLKIAIMQSCAYERQYIYAEITRAADIERHQQTSEEKELTNQILTRITSYLHSKDFYQSCISKTNEEWSNL